MNKAGRPHRTDNPQRLTLRLSKQSKMLLYQMATETNRSLGRVVEDLVAADVAAATATAQAVSERMAVALRVEEELR